MGFPESKLPSQTGLKRVAEVYFRWQSQAGTNTLIYHGVTRASGNPTLTSGGTAGSDGDQTSILSISCGKDHSTAVPLSHYPRTSRTGLGNFPRYAFAARVTFGLLPFGGRPGPLLLEEVVKQLVPGTSFGRCLTGASRQLYDHLVEPKIMM